MSAKMYSNWTLFIAPVILHRRFKKPQYYKHFMRLVESLKLCLSFEILDAMLNQINEGFHWWVKEYEKWAFLVQKFHSNLYRLYYENNPAQLSTCPLTIHALLHIAWGFKVAGPVWVGPYWAYPMECHCNTLLQAIKSRRRPHASINSFVTATAQLNQIRLMYNLHEVLCLDSDKEKSGLIQDSCKF